MSDVERFSGLTDPEVLAMAREFFGVSSVEGNRTSPVPEKTRSPLPKTGWQKRVLNGKRVRVLDLGAKGVLRADFPLRSNWLGPSKSLKR